MKKIAGGIISLFSLSFVSAGPVQGTQQLLDGAQQIIAILLQFIFNISYSLGVYNQYLFAKIILMILIYIIVYTVSKETVFKKQADEKNFKILYIISAAVAILAIKYLPDEYIQAILLPYSSLGVGLSVFLPLFIYFYFIEKSFTNAGAFVRRAAWVIFGASFIALWSTRYESIGNANWIYWIGIAFIALCFTFDKQVQDYFQLAEIKKTKKAHHVDMIAEYEDSLNKIDRQLLDHPNLPKEVKEQLEKKRNQLIRQQAHHYKQF